MTTTNEATKLEWTEVVGMKRISNRSSSIIEYAVNPEKPNESILGHSLMPLKGLSNEEFEEGSRFWFRCETPATLAVTK